MDLLGKLRGIAYLGLDNQVASLRYWLQRRGFEQRWAGEPVDDRRQGPGLLQELIPGPNGVRLRFATAELEVELLDTDVARVTWTPGRLPVPYALQPRSWPGGAPAIEHEGRTCKLRTDALSVEIAADGGLRFSDPEGRTLRAEHAPRHGAAGWEHRASMRPEERVYGLGERTAGFDLRGGRYRLWNTEPKGSYGPETDPIYICLPVYLGLHRQGSYLVFYENSHDGEVAFQRDAWARFSAGALRYYLIPGPPERALRRLGELTGRAPLPPRWALGFHQSRWSYANEAEVLELLAGFALHDLPLAAVHLDIHYMQGHRVFTVDPRRFPDLPGLAAQLHRRGVRLVLILDPAVKHDPEYDVYASGHSQGAFCRLPDGREVIAPVWPGDAAFPDFTDPQARRWWGEQYGRLLEWGADGVWHDMNEPAAFTPFGDPTLPSATLHSMDGRGGDHREAHNLYALLEARAGWEALRAQRPDRRPWILSRSGWVGLQRYAWTWTGDSPSTWWSLAQSVRMALSLGLAGVPYSGPDVGGFNGEPDAELFTRWFQLGALLPLFRVHSAFFTPRREPWSFGAGVLEHLKAALGLRMRLMPYLYTAAWQTSEQGAPLVRPLFWPDGADPELWDVDDAFLLGDNLLVAPVMAAGATERTVRLPAGEWFDLQGEQRWAGGQEQTLPAPAERIPVLVRGGSVLPTEDEGGSTLHLYPATTAGPQAGGVLYRDEGDGYGPHRVERFGLSREPGSLVLTRTVEGEHQPSDPLLRVVVHGETVIGATVDGEERPLLGDRLEVPAFLRLTVRLKRSEA